MPNIRLESCDKEIFVVDFKVAKCFGVIRMMMEDVGLKQEHDAIIPLPAVDSNILKKILEYANYHKDDPQPVEVDARKIKMTDDICAWDTAFLNIDQGTLFKLILAANYLDIKGLLDIAYKTVANMMKGKTALEIRRTFGLQDDSSPEEEPKVCRQADVHQDN